MTTNEYLSFLNGKLEYLLIDDACQLTELQTVLTMRFYPRRVVLCGNLTYSMKSSLFNRLLDSTY